MSDTSSDTSSDHSLPPSRGAGAPHAFEAVSLEAALTVSDVETSLAWYRDVMGFAVTREFRRGDVLFAVSLRAGAVRILLGQDDGAKGAGRTKGEGFSLQLTTAQDVDAVAAAIRRRGGTLESDPFDAHGVRAFRLRDPDGFRMTVSSPRREASA